MVLVWGSRSTFACSHVNAIHSHHYITMMTSVLGLHIAIHNDGQSLTKKLLIVKLFLFFLVT
jgi:hypothetical protein